MHAVMKIQSYCTRGNTEKYQNDNYIDQGDYGENKLMDRSLCFNSYFKRW